MLISNFFFFANSLAELPTLRQKSVILRFFNKITILRPLVKFYDFLDPLYYVFFSDP